MLLECAKSRADIHPQVDIFREEFDLKDSEKGRLFLLGLYNFGNEVKRLGSALGKRNYTQLQKIMKAGENLPSWSSHKTGAGQTSKSAHVSASPNLQTVDEEQSEDIQAAVDASEDMQRAVQEFGLTGDLYMVVGVSSVWFPPVSPLNNAFQNPFVALVYSNEDNDQRYYLKLLRPGRTAEAGILAHLAKVDSPDNHAIRPVASRVCEKGTLLLLPYAGVPIRDYEDDRRHLVSFADQFLRGVAFLHEHRVAHCDLKTANVVVDRVSQIW